MEREYPLTFRVKLLSWASSLGCFNHRPGDCPEQIQKTLLFLPEGSPLIREEVLFGYWQTSSHLLTPLLHLSKIKNQRVITRRFICTERIDEELLNLRFRWWKSEKSCYQRNSLTGFETTVIDLLPFQQSWNVGQERITFIASIFVLSLACHTEKKRILSKTWQTSTDLRSSHPGRLEFFLYFVTFSAVFISRRKTFQFNFIVLPCW